MAETSHCALSEPVMDELRFLASSVSRTAVLEHLVASPASKAELRTETGVPASTVSRNLTELEERGLVTEDVRENNYEATAGGEIALDAVTAAATRFETVRVATAVSEHVEETAVFPLTEPMLCQCSFVRATAASPQAPLTRLATTLADTDRVRGVTPHLRPAALETLSREASGDVDVQIGVSPSAVDALRSHYEERSVDPPITGDVFFEVADLPEYGVALVDDRVVCGFYDEKGVLAAVLVSPREAAEWVAWAQDVFSSRFDSSLVPTTTE
jgi:predicted transcriptional regulator